MTTTVKLASDIEARLRAHCARAGESISEVMRKALVAHLDAAQAAPQRSAFELGSALFGRYHGPVDLSASYREQRADLWAEVANAKSARRSA